MSLKKKFPEIIYDLALQNNFRRKIFERTSAFKLFHKETGGNIGEFLETHEGQMLADKMDYPTSRERAISVKPQLIKDRYLEIRLDLTRPKEILRAEFEAILNKHHKPQPTPPRGIKIPDLENMDQVFLAFDLVEKHDGNYLKATWELFPETNGTYTYDNYDTDKKLQQVLRWHNKIKIFIPELDLPDLLPSQ